MQTRVATASQMAALLGFTQEITFEGQGAIWLENQARQSDGQPPYDFPQLDHRVLLQAVIADRLADRQIADIAFAFHAAFAGEIARSVANGHLLTKTGFPRDSAFGLRAHRSLTSANRSSSAHDRCACETDVGFG